MPNWNPVTRHPPPVTFYVCRTRNDPHVHRAADSGRGEGGDRARAGRTAAGVAEALRPLDEARAVSSYLVFPGKRGDDAGAGVDRSGRRGVSRLSRLETARGTPRVFSGSSFSTRRVGLGA